MPYKDHDAHLENCRGYHAANRDTELERYREYHAANRDSINAKKRLKYAMEKVK